MSDQERARVLELQNPFGLDHLRWHPIGAPGPITLGLSACNLYRATTEQGVITGWERQKLPEDFDPLSGCVSHSIGKEGLHAVVMLCKQIIGAGSCRRQVFHSADGLRWEIRPSGIGG